MSLVQLVLNVFFNMNALKSLLPREKVHNYLINQAKNGILPTSHRFDRHEATENQPPTFIKSLVYLPELSAVCLRTILTLIAVLVAQIMVVPPNLISTRYIRWRNIQGRYRKRTLDWEGLGIKMGVDADAHTIKRRMNALGYRKCRACQKKWLSDKNIEKRWTVSEEWRHLPNWEWEDWHFSDKFHTEHNARGAEYVIRLPEERNCGDYMQKKMKRGKAEWYCWAMIDYNYKSELVFYDLDELNPIDAVPRTKSNPLGRV